MDHVHSFQVYGLALELEIRNSSPESCPHSCYCRLEAVTHSFDMSPFPRTILTMTITGYRFTGGWEGRVKRGCIFCFKFFSHTVSKIDNSTRRSAVSCSSPQEKRRLCTGFWFLTPLTVPSVGSPLPSPFAVLEISRGGSSDVSSPHSCGFMP